MNMKSQDVVVALKLCTITKSFTYAELAKSLGMSASEVHASIHRLINARLVDPDKKTVHREPFRNFIVHGVPYAFPANAKEMTRGMPTAWTAPVMHDDILGEDDPVVWPESEGIRRGASVKPLYRSVVEASRNDDELYDLLALVDSIRLGRARERKIAEEKLAQKLENIA
jgi:DNA-binding Lrp family transcriptional regulator